ELPSGHIMIPWMGGFYYNSGYEAPIPSKTECRSLLQHIRLRGSAGYYTWSNGDNTNYTSKVDYRDDMYANAWQPLDWFFSYPASEVIFNLATNKTGGVEWSGMRRGNRCLFIFSNYTGNAVQVNLPGTVENLPAQSPSIASGEHLMMDYIVGPLSYWKLDENTENNVYDKMEGNYSGTITGASWSAGKNGSALTFDGIGGGVNFGDILDIGTKDRSVSLWFKTTDSSNQKSLISKGYSCTSNEFSLYLYSGNIIGLMDINGTDYIVSSNQTVNDGQWHHAVLTIARNDKMSLYLDGTLKANVDVSAVASVNAQNNYNLYLGRSHYGQYFAGTIDEVKIFSSALTEQEVFDEYAAVLNLHFNERQDSTVADDSIYSNDGTVSSGSWTNGKSGSCLNFTGGYDSFSVTDSSSLDLSSEISVETWFYPTAYGSGYATFPVSKWARYNTSTANFTMYFFGATAGSNYKKICFAANAGGTWKTVSPTYSIDQLNTWYHIVWTYSATNGGKLYVNGVSQGSAVGSGSLYINNSNVVIGDQVQGKIDEVKIFNKALSEDEVIRQYNRY
ncbi:MAG: LamG domain-containing protein, partial [Victivallaceae bacterium]